MTIQVISDSLYDSDELPLPGAAIREVAVEVLTERGRTTTFAASRSLQRERGDDLPLICTEERLPWFDAKAPSSAEARRGGAAGGASGASGAAAAAMTAITGGATRRRAAAAGGAAAAADELAELTDLKDLKERPHVLFLGLAFLDGNQLTIDVDDRRMALVVGNVAPV